MVERVMNVQTPIEPASDQYETDFHAWLMEQAARLKQRNAEALDWDNLAEEIESLGKSLIRELNSRIAVILEHLLKYEFGRQREPARGWSETIITQRTELEELLEQNPGLRSQVSNVIASRYDRARRNTLDAFRLYEPTFERDYAEEIPAENPYSVDMVMDRAFFPVSRHP